MARADSVVATVPVGSIPAGVVFDSANNEIYVANNNDSVISVISGSTNTVISTVPIKHPYGLAFDSADGDIYATSIDSIYISVIDGTTNTISGSITVGVPACEGIFYDAVSGNLYVTCEDGATGRIFALPGATTSAMAELRAASGTHPLQLTVDTVNDNVYVADFEGGGGLTVISGSANTLIDNVLKGYNFTDVAFDSASGNLYATNYDSGNVTVIDGKTYRVLANVRLCWKFPTYARSIIFDAANNDIYALNTPCEAPTEGAGDYVTLISGSTNTVIGSVQVGRIPHGIAVDTANGDIYVTNAGSNTVSVIAPSSAFTSAKSSSTAVSTTGTASSESAGGGGIPAFPYQIPVVAFFTAVVVLSYLLIRRPRARQIVVGTDGDRVSPFRELAPGSPCE